MDEPPPPTSQPYFVDYFSPHYLLAVPMIFIMLAIYFQPQHSCCRQALSRISQEKFPNLYTCFFKMQGCLTSLCNNIYVYLEVNDDDSQSLTVTPLSSDELPSSEPDLENPTSDTHSPAPVCPG